MTSKQARPSLGRVVKPTAMPDLSDRFSMRQLGAAITAKRTGMKLKLTDVSKALSLSKPTLVKIEKGDPNVNFVNVLRVMELLGLSFSIISDDDQLASNDLHSERVSNPSEDDDVWY